MNNYSTDELNKSLTALEVYNQQSAAELIDALNTSKKLLIESAVIGGLLATASMLFVVGGFIITNL